MNTRCVRLDIGANQYRIICKIHFKGSVGI
ncbi:MAG: hypothetical protein EBY37_08370 [Flavobacteriia bacterium]|nr:hypothetical protein [Flavobacteriia bacterium]